MATPLTSFPEETSAIHRGSIVDEKILSTGPVPSDFVGVPGYNADLTWTKAEERRAVLKCDCVILSFVVLLFTFMQFDRSNLGSALTDTLRTDINVGNTEINTAQSLFILGFILTELPFNIISKRIGPERWLPITMFLWGTFTWCQVFLKNAAGLIALRFFIGAMEGGYIPGMAFFISRFYTNKELGLRFAFFWASNAIAGALVGPLALGILSLNGRNGLHGWQWLFLLEGVLTCFLAVVAYFYLPHSPARPKSFCGFSWNMFSERESQILTMRVLRDDPGKGRTVGVHVKLVDVKDAFSTWRIYGHCVSAFLSMLMIYPINTYAPSLIASLGFARYDANGLNSVGSVLALCVSISLAWDSDRTQERGLHIAIGFIVGIVGLLWAALVSDSVSKWVIYAGVILTEGGMGSAQAINAAWLSEHVDDRLRPIALAMYVMSIQLAGFPGNQLFQAQWAPRYQNGMIIAAAGAAAGVIVVLVWKFFVYRRDDKLKAMQIDGQDRYEESSESGPTKAVVAM